MYLHLKFFFSQNVLRNEPMLLFKGQGFVEVTVNRERHMTKCANKKTEAVSTVAMGTSCWKSREKQVNQLRLNFYLILYYLMICFAYIQFGLEINKHLSVHFK